MYNKWLTLRTASENELLSDDDRPSQVRAFEIYDDLYEQRILHEYKVSIINAIYALPYHMNAIERDYAFDHGADEVKKAELVSNVILSPPFHANYSKLRDNEIVAYNRSWCKLRSVCIEGSKLKIDPLGPEPDPTYKKYDKHAMKHAYPP